MKVISIQVGRRREVEWRGKTVLTSIFKQPVPGPVTVHRLNLAGDEQADPSVHGGADKAVYAYPGEHYDFWRDQLPGLDLPWGAFGENLTTEGLDERSLGIGDRLVIGTTELQVTGPRLPCFKLGLRFGRPDMVKRFLRSRRTGFYLAVLGEGEIAPSDPIRRLPAAGPVLIVADVVRLHAGEPAPADLLHRAAEHPLLPEDWREHFRRRLRRG